PPVGVMKKTSQYTATTKYPQYDYGANSNRLSFQQQQQHPSKVVKFSESAQFIENVYEDENEEGEDEATVPQGGQEVDDGRYNNNNHHNASSSNNNPDGTAFSKYS